MVSIWTMWRFSYTCQILLPLLKNYTRQESQPEVTVGLTHRSFITEKSCKVGSNSINSRFRRWKRVGNKYESVEHVAKGREPDCLGSHPMGWCSATFWPYAALVSIYKLGKTVAPRWPSFEVMMIKSTKIVNTDLANIKPVLLGKGNMGLGFHDPLIRTFWSSDQCITIHLDFPGSPVVKTLLTLQGVWIQSLVEELRFCVPSK